VRVGQQRKRDLNEPGIVYALEQIGCLVQKISEPGFADLIVRHPRQGFVLIEIKSQKGRLTQAQVQHERDGWPVCIVRSVAEALALFGVVT